ncbi:MAG: (d)CMP kinase [Melioribacteraceae bacterium]|nr:(d)CMP kinase [Melioribacteraceae bacterium]MCF8355656.1 (d)CMP kinase [Melioribacteraceae bacterium]MCF8395142.1 (d)CMP kinase [Melioribacteraceae bacterium]MCF8420564.1 (d)CMP kinase [Melioribacteraceae bacterium]
MSKNIIIAIDGPAASGKSTAAKNLAETLNLIYVDTGAMYRAITYKAIEAGIAEDEKKVIELTKRMKIELRFENGITRVFVDGDDITENIRTSEVNSKVSDISKISEVRSEMVKIQKRMSEDGNLIAEGRDVTTVVFPDADVKIYLTASLDVRAERRYKENLEKGFNSTLDEVKENLEKRDYTDSHREVSPLKKADDAIEFDTTNLNIKEELKKLTEIVREKISL